VAYRGGHHGLRCRRSLPKLLTSIGNEDGFSKDSQAFLGQVTGLHLAAYFGLKEAMIALLENGHDLNSKNSYGQTPLLWAAKNGYEAMVKLLLGKGARLEAGRRVGCQGLSRSDTAIVGCRKWAQDRSEAAAREGR
jgi:hypothetical protein